LLVGTTAGLPARLVIRADSDEIEVVVKEEYGGWDAVGIESWAVGEEGAWCGGGEGGLRRY
jgi:proteasomal ATPase-associated factor 1